jgi:hypothetical protein
MNWCIVCNHHNGEQSKTNLPSMTDSKKQNKKEKKAKSKKKGK